MEPATKGTGRKTYSMALAKKFGQMGLAMKAIMIKARSTDVVSTYGLMVLDTTETGTIIE